MKKIATTALALTIALSSMAVTAFADPDPKAPGKEEVSTEAGVKFIDGQGPVIIEEDDEWQDIDSMGIHFGTRARYTKEMVFDSMDGSNLNQDGVKDEVLAPAEKQRIGLIVDNDTTDASWQVTCSVDSFKAGSKQTLKGFELRLAQNGEIYQKEAIGGPKPTTAGADMALKASDAGSFGSPVMLFKTGTDTDGGFSVGRWGANYKGALTVPGGSMMNVGKNEEVSAVLKWQIGAVV